MGQDAQRDCFEIKKYVRASGVYIMNKSVSLYPARGHLVYEY